MKKAVLCLLIIAALLLNGCAYKVKDVTVNYNGREIYRLELITSNGTTYYQTYIGAFINYSPSSQYSALGDIVAEAKYKDAEDETWPVHRIKNSNDDSLLILPRYGLADYCYVMVREDFDMSFFANPENIDNVYFATSLEYDEWTSDHHSNPKYIKEKPICDSSDASALISMIMEFECDEAYNDEWVLLGHFFLSFKNTGDLLICFPIYYCTDSNAIVYYPTDISSIDVPIKSTAYVVPVDALSESVVGILFSDFDEEN